MFLSRWIVGLGWVFWMVILVITLVVLWLVMGGQEHRFIGLSPLSDPALPVERYLIAPGLPGGTATSGGGFMDRQGWSAAERPPTRRETEIPLRDQRHVAGPEPPSSQGNTEANARRSEAMEAVDATPQLPPGLFASRPTSAAVPVGSIAATPVASPPTLNSTTASSHNVASHPQPYPYSQTRQRPQRPPKLDPRNQAEAICRQTLEEIYGVPFLTHYPVWLRNPETGQDLELDCYNPDVGIAVEYNGPQHYKWPNHYPMTKEKFLAQVRRDRYKVDACDANGVYLITVPYNVPYDLIPAYIRYYLPEAVASRLAEMPSEAMAARMQQAST